MVTIGVGALTVGEESGQIGVAAWTLFDTRLDTGAGGWELESAMLAISAWTAAVWSERRKEGAAFEAMLFQVRSWECGVRSVGGIFDF